MPCYEKFHDSFIAQGIDTVACLAVNDDAFVMYQSALSREVEKTVMLPYGIFYAHSRH
ncbi:MAG: hypothetical protein AB8B64_24795 [Granulosicoccus sp.]